MKRKLGLSLGSLCLAGSSMLFTSGCDQKEEVLDIETPRSEIEVERDTETGEVDVETSRDRDPID